MSQAPASEPGSVSQDLVELKAAREGDQGAARSLVARHGPSMLRTAWRVLGRYGRTEADDVVQEALIAALTTPALPTGDVGAWLRSIAARKSLDWLRRAKRRSERPLPEMEEEGREPEARDEMGAALDVLTVRRGLARLSATDRAVLTLVDLEGHSMAEAAEALSLTRAAVKLRAMRARRKLARVLQGGRPVGAESGSRASRDSE
jgi:RNA polymerase sigma-70 factor (ECF subfamily)